MAINTVAGQDIGTRLRYRLSDPTSQTFQDDELNTHLSWAVQEYSNYRPLTGFYSFDTANGLQSYPISTSIMTITRHDYTNLGDMTITSDNVDSNLDWTYLTGQLHDDAMRFIRDEFRGRWDNITYGQIKVVNQSWLELFPTPIDSFGVTIEYLTQHTLQGSDYPTIPFQDTGIISDLLLSTCWEIEVDEMMRQGDFKAGQTEVARKIGELRKRSIQLKESVYRRLSATSVSSME